MALEGATQQIRIAVIDDGEGVDPMDFEPNEEQKLIVEQVRRFVHEEIIPLEATLDPDASEIEPEDFARLSDKVKAMGLWGLDVPIEYGG
ncbi:MAG: acyl-CoA dehydrogenase, partial [Hyphomicrobiaceae bacterium]